MSDVRALLKAKRQEARINHPYASYTSSGQLKCSVCGTAIKHASAWEGHLGSKAHRTNVVRQREEERSQREQSKVQTPEEDEEGQAHTAGSSKRKTPDDDPADEHKEKRRKVDNKSMPADFFSDPSRAPVLLSDASDEDDGISEIAQPKPELDVPKSAIDLEYDLFQRELTKTTDSLDVFNRATVIAEPVAAPSSISGFPTATAETNENEGPTEAEIRQKREQEEKELIMDRLLEEERAQEDADTRVLLLKNKVELLRQKRQARVKISKSSVQ